MTDIHAICQNLGITTSAYYKRLKRWGNPELAANQQRYESTFRYRPVKPRQPKPKQGRPEDYAHHFCAYPLTDEQRAISRVMRGWK